MKKLQFLLKVVLPRISWCALIKKKKVPKIVLPEEVKYQLNELAAMTCAVDMRPLSLFEGPGIIKFCQELIDTAAQTGRFDFQTTIVDHGNLSRHYVDDVYKKYRAEIQSEFKSAISMGHNTDGWQDKFTGRDYMSLVCFYVTDTWEWRKIVWTTEEFDVSIKNADAVRKWYMGQLDKIELQSGRHYIVADNASVMECAFKDLNGTGCAAHCLNLVVNGMTNGVPEIQELLKCSKKLVGQVKKSGLQKKLSRRLSQSMCVRWNSTLMMIKSIETVWDCELTQLLIERNETNYLADINIGTLRELIDFLTLFKTATDVMEADDQPNIHLIIFWYFRLQKHLIFVENDSETIKKLKKLGLTLLTENWAKRFRPIHYAATLLDPRAKNCKLTHDQRSKGEDFIKDLYIELNPDIDDTEKMQRETTTDPDEEDFYATNCVESNHEFDDYMRELPVIVRSGNELLNYWKNTKFTHLAKVARVILAVPASSASSERSFSEAGFTINVRRTSIKPENVNKLLFLRSALKMEVFPNEDEDDVDVNL